MRATTKSATTSRAWAADRQALVAKHHWLVIACDACGTVVDLDLRVKPRDPEASVHFAPNLLVAEARPRRHRGTVHSVTNGEKSFPGGARVRPRRQLQVRGLRNHRLSPLAMAIAIFAVADSTIGCKNGAAGLLGIAGQPVVNGAGSDHGQIYGFRHQAVQRHRDRDRDRDRRSR